MLPYDDFGRYLIAKKGDAAELVVGWASETLKIGVTIRPFRNSDSGVFRRLSLAWITQYFPPEDKDLEALADPGAIVDRGGAILMVDAGEETIGCAALIRRDTRTLELAKFTVAEGHRGVGIGHELMCALIVTARTMGAASLYLESNSALTEALSLYRRFGFQDLPAGERPTSPYNTADVFMRLDI